MASFCVGEFRLNGQRSLRYSFRHLTAPHCLQARSSNWEPAAYHAGPSSAAEGQNSRYRLGLIAGYALTKTRGNNLAKQDWLTTKYQRRKPNACTGARMPNVSIVRNHEGDMNLAVAGHYALGSRVIAVTNNHQGEMVAVVHIPLKDVVFEEQSTVVPFKRRDD